LGGVAKGWTADWVVESGEAQVVSAGGDVRSTRRDTLVEVAGGDGLRAARVHLGVGALATSSTQRRSWSVAGSRVHHLIDPRRGRPASTPVTTASAIAATAVEAEAAAKAVLLLGGAGLAWADSQSWIRAALAVWEDGSVYATAGLEAA
jgi:thiamine biosynthesis lipoprotein